MCPIVQRTTVANIRTGHGILTPSCGFSFPSFGRRLAFSELLRQVVWSWSQQISSLWLRQVFSFSLDEFSSVWPRLQPEPAIPAWAVSECDGGHGAAIRCWQLLLPSAAQYVRDFGVRPQGILESF